jgi:hypothetical protein
MRYLTSAPASLNMMVVCRAAMQKPSRLTSAWSNGSYAIQSIQAPAYVSAVVAVTSTEALWCHSARRRRTHMAAFGLLASMARRPEDRSYGSTDVDGDRDACRASGDLKKGAHGDGIGSNRTGWLLFTVCS